MEHIDFEERAIEMPELTVVGKTQRVGRILYMAENNANQGQAVATTAARWRDAEDVCTFANSERHLGHVVREVNQWLAWDATRFDDAGKGIRCLGTFPSLRQAKAAVEVAVLSPSSVSTIQ